MRWTSALGCLVAIGCTSPVEPPSTCGETGSLVEASSAPDRRVLGVAADYPADLTLEGRFGELARSQRLRRAAAWEAVARVLAPVPTHEALPLTGATVPRWRTFYDREDFGRLFQNLFGGLPPEDRIARARLSDEQVDAAFLWNVGFVDTLGSWPETRFQDYLATLDSPDAVNRVGGIGRIGMSPAMTRHIMQSYPEVLDCLEHGPPGPEVAGVPREDTLLRDAIALGPCGTANIGPIHVPRDGALRASLAPRDEDASESPPRLTIHEGPSAAAATLVCDGVEDCEVAGPGDFHVRVVARDAGFEGVLAIQRTVVDAPVTCLAGALPADAVSVAAEWRRIDPALPFPTFDTSGDALAELTTAETPTWELVQSGETVPPDDAIYSQRLETGARFVLAGLHIRTRELPLGFNITLWWSDDPDTDFGADRPESVRALGGPWSNYKMCVAIDHMELDPAPDGGFADDAPTLGRALGALHEGRGGPTWCSNPYIDAAPGLAMGNCVGCHQHGMSGIRPGEVATDEARFPSNGRLPARNNYPSDGSWALDAGDDLAARIDEIVDFFIP